MTQKTSKTSLSESLQDTLASCLVVISFFVILFVYVGIMSNSYVITCIVGGIYLLSLWGYILIFTGRSTSETLRRVMILFSIVGVAISVFLLGTYSMFFI
jgi:hypothetical protein